MSSYRAAGVDIEAADRFVGSISDAVTKTWGIDTVGGFGGFAAGVRIPAGYTRPVLMMSTDGVGTKLEVARRHDALDGVGFDVVAMCVDDLAAVGATPLAFTDYLAVGKLDPDREERIVRSIAAACATAGCALVGGETAEHPGVVAEHHVDIAGCVVGVVEQGHEVTGSNVRPGDVILGIHSPNLRSNGFSLIRAIYDLDRLDEPFEDGRSLGDVLCEPSVIYAPAVLAATATGGVHGLAHITGGGLPGNVGRTLPEGLGAVIDTDSWTPPYVFIETARRGSVPPADMYATFNMGVGFVAIVDPASIEDVTEAFKRRGHVAQPIGHVEESVVSVTLIGEDFKR